MLIDTHAHLDYPDFATDFDAVLARATEAGVTRILTIGTSIESSRRAVELAEKYSNVFAVIGVHPNYAEEAGEDVITPLARVGEESARRGDRRDRAGLSSSAERDGGAGK